MTNLLEFFEVVTRELDEGKDVDIVYLDFSKAFDKVPHVRLVRKIEANGISGNISNWIKNWLSNRYQRVSVDGELSGWVSVGSGVPQGSVLGPLLFLIYINDLDDGIMSLLRKFADDTKLGKSISGTEDVMCLQNDLDILKIWSVLWQMEYNVGKCGVLHLGKKNSKNKYTLNGQTLKESVMEKDLGILIDNSLKFSEQCNSAAKSANRVLGMIKRNINCKNKHIILKLYKSLVRPKLEYCIQCWSPFLKKDIDKLEKVQKRATRMIEECRGMNYEQRLKFTGLTSLVERRIRGDMIEVFKIIKGFDKINSESFFDIRTSSRTRGHKLKIEKKRSRLEIRKNFFSQRIVNEWNKLPEHVIEAESVNCFKNRYDDYISNRKVID